MEKVVKKRKHAGESKVASSLLWFTQDPSLGPWSRLSRGTRPFREESCSLLLELLRGILGETGGGREGAVSSTSSSSLL